MNKEIEAKHFREAEVWTKFAKKCGAPIPLSDLVWFMITDHLGLVFSDRKKTWMARPPDFKSNFPATFVNIVPQPPKEER